MEVVLDEMENSWTRATPVEARTREVRTYARKVLSEARWSLATEPLFSSVRLIRMVLSKGAIPNTSSVVGRMPEFRILQRRRGSIVQDSLVGHFVVEIGRAHV